MTNELLNKNDEELVQKIEDSVLKKYIKEYFPFKKDGVPQFREYQPQTILHICKSILESDKKFHLIEAPVGSGKSVINYTVLRVVSQVLEGKSTMLTSMKALQDQIAAEGWPEIKSLKGKSGYACSHCQGMHSNSIRSNYDGEDFGMCNNSSPVKCNITYEERVSQIRDSIEKLIESANEVTLRFKTNFANADEFDSLIVRIVGFYRKIYISETSKPPEERATQYKKLISISECIKNFGNDNYVDTYVKNQAISSISCTMRKNLDGQIECAAKSARVLSRILGIRLLNPDIFYYLTMKPSSFSTNDAMIIDEAHGWSSVMNRIFDIKVPVDTISKVYGINLSSIYKIEDKREILNELIKMAPELSKVSCAIKTIRRITSMVNVRRPSHIEYVAKAETEISRYFKNFASNWFIDNPDDDFDIVSLIDKYVFQKKGFDEKYSKDPFFKAISNRYDSYLENSGFIFDDDTTSIIGIRDSICKWIGREMELMIGRETKAFFNKSSSEPSLSLNSVCNSYFIKLRDYLDQLIRVLGVVDICFREFTLKPKNKEDGDEIEEEDKIYGSSAFGVYKKVVDGTHSIMGTPLEKIKYIEKEKRTRILTISVVNPGQIARMYFYSKTKKVVFTSGTWVFLDSMKRSLGVGKDDYEFYRVPSVFDKNKRPIYIVKRAALTNFSEKLNDGKTYVYKTDEGANKFVTDTQRFVKAVQNFMIENYKEYLTGPPNIIIHSHSFLLTRLMAENGDYDDKWLFHTGSSTEYLRNKITNQQFATHDKNTCIDTLCREHDKGYVFISPSITEGVDLKYGAARAQIILKFPIPNIIDPYVQTISRGDPELGILPDDKYIDRLIWSTLTQAYGRVMRDKKDWGFTFLLDQVIPKRFNWLFSTWSQAKAERININNPYFFEAVKYVTLHGGKPDFRLPFKFD